MTCPDLDADVFKYSASLGLCTSKNGFTWRDFWQKYMMKYGYFPKLAHFSISTS
jgi:hypothetical protein